MKTAKKKIEAYKKENNKHKLYLCYLEYFATGEGLTFAIAAVYATSKDDAKAKFVEKFMCDLAEEENKKQCVLYFSQGVKVYDFTKKSKHNEMKKIMASFFTNSVIESLFDAQKHGALGEFYFKLYSNYS